MDTWIGTKSYIGWNRMGWGPFGPSFVTLGRVEDLLPNLQEMYVDNKTSVLLDYTEDFQMFCPDYHVWHYNKPLHISWLKVPASILIKWIGDITGISG
jgi:hypothetical protein